MAHAPLIMLALVAGCGRISFDARGDGGNGDGSNGGSTVDAPISNGLVAWYKLEGQLDLPPGVFDSSGNGHHGLCASVCPVPAVDRHGGMGAQLFDGATTELVIPTTAGFDLPTFTVATWFYPNANNPNPFEILVSRAFGGAQANSFALDVANGSLLEYYSQPDNSLFGVSVYLYLQWQHVAITFDGTTKRIYYMGALETEITAAAPVTYDAHPITIGTDISGESYAYHFDGRLDDVMIFDRALSQAELTDLAAFP